MLARYESARSSLKQGITTDTGTRGRLRAGDALPGSRTLATSLGVHRNTVLAANRGVAMFLDGVPESLLTPPGPWVKTPDIAAH